MTRSRSPRHAIPRHAIPRHAARIASLLLVAPVLLYAQTTSEHPVPAHAAPQAIAAPRTVPIAIDGRLDEAAWQQAPSISQFTQQEPVEGAPATQRTDVRVVYDDQAIYIGARMYDSLGASGVRGRLVRRDADPNSDLLTIDLDPFRDRLHHSQFTINPSGVRGDALDGDASWDPVWEAAAHVDSLGWTAELRIPLSQLRFPRDSVQRWGFEITRVVQRLHEQDLWSFYGRKQVGGPAFYGELTGLAFHARPSRLQVIPYGVVRASRLTPESSNPLYDPHRTDVRAGADLRYLATSNLTLSATVNPDFGQVEVDPAVVNLTAFETYFPEKRPFFVEGANLFGFGQPGCNINCGLGLDLFYSRRIGRAPQGASLAQAAGQYTDIPENTTILGAAKLTGRTAGGFTLGILDAVTGRAAAPVITSDGRHISQDVEPPTNDFVARVTHESRDGNVVLGGMLTSAARDIRDPGLASLLDRHAEVGGVDGELWWGKHTYHAYAALSASDVGGDSAAILRLQRSSARYLQRPDRTTSRIDPTATTLRGVGAIARVSKAGGNWLWDLNGASVSPGFEPNDLGFLQTADWRWVNGSFGRQFTAPTRLYRTLTLMTGAEQTWNYDGDVTGHDMSGVAQVELPNYWTTSLFVMRQPGAFSDRLTRGGPVVRQSANWWGSYRLSTDVRRALVIGTSPTYERDDDGAFSNAIDLSVTWRPASSIAFTLDPRLSAFRATDQYVRAVRDSTAARFYGTRYVFAHLNQRTFSMTTRASMTFTPSLSLEAYMQPLIASGHYEDFEEFAAPRRLRKVVYGRDVGTISSTGTAGSLKYTVDPDASGPAAPFTIDNPDFNIRSLRGTAVLRWEYSPGSTAYLVWTQTRDGVAPLGNLDFARDRAALFAEHPDNIFLLKVSYWLGL